MSVRPAKKTARIAQNSHHEILNMQPREESLSDEVPTRGMLAVTSYGHFILNQKLCSWRHCAIVT